MRNIYLDVEAFELSHFIIDYLVCNINVDYIYSAKMIGNAGTHFTNVDVWTHNPNLMKIRIAFTWKILARSDNNFVKFQLWAHKMRVRCIAGVSSQPLPCVLHKKSCLTPVVFDKDQSWGPCHKCWEKCIGLFWLQIGASTPPPMLKSWGFCWPNFVTGHFDLMCIEGIWNSHLCIQKLSWNS